MVCQLLRELVSREADNANNSASASGVRRDAGGPLRRVQAELMSCLYTDYSDQVSGYRACRTP